MTLNGTQLKELKKQKCKRKVEIWMILNIPGSIKMSARWRK